MDTLSRASSFKAIVQCQVRRVCESKIEFFRTKCTSKICKTADAEVLAIQRGEGCSLQAVLAQSAEKEESSQCTQPSSAA